eukprot:PhM_4_TR10499/c0_g2_i1/m.88665
MARSTTRDDHPRRHHVLTVPIASLVLHHEPQRIPKATEHHRVWWQTARHRIQRGPYVRRAAARGGADVQLPHEFDALGARARAGLHRRRADADREVPPRRPLPRLEQLSCHGEGHAYYDDYDHVARARRDVCAPRRVPSLPCGQPLQCDGARPHTTERNVSNKDPRHQPHRGRRCDGQRRGNRDVHQAAAGVLLRREEGRDGVDYPVQGVLRLSHAGEEPLRGRVVPDPPGHVLRHPNDVYGNRDTYRHGAAYTDTQRLPRGVVQQRLGHRQQNGLGQDGAGATVRVHRAQVAHAQPGGTALFYLHLPDSMCSLQQHSLHYVERR